MKRQVLWAGIWLLRILIGNGWFGGICAREGSVLDAEWNVPDTCQIGARCEVSVRIYPDLEKGDSCSGEWILEAEWVRWTENDSVYVRNISCQFQQVPGMLICRMVFQGLALMEIPGERFQVRVFTPAGTWIVPGPSRKKIVIAPVPDVRKPDPPADPLPAPGWFPYVLGGGILLGLVLTGILIYWLTRRFILWRHEKRLRSRDPLEIFLETLRKTVAELSEESVRARAVDRASDAFRQLLASLTNLPLLESTTREVHLHLQQWIRKQSEKPDPSLLPKTIEILNWADRVKFAGFLPSQEEALQWWEELEKMGRIWYEWIRRSRESAENL